MNSTEWWYSQVYLMWEYLMRRHVPSNPCKMQNRLFIQKNLAETDIHNNHTASHEVCTEMPWSKLKSQIIIAYSFDHLFS